VTNWPTRDAVLADGAHALAPEREIRIGKLQAGRPFLNPL
jgi:hypothetical protein